MKKRKLDDLLSKMASHSSFGPESAKNIVSLQDELSQSIIGGLTQPTQNTTCAGNNGNCANGNCAGSTNGVCGNASCRTDSDVEVGKLV